MSTLSIALDDIHIATPCRASWDRMHGDNRVRFCDQCDKHVYNLTGMSRAEAEALIRRTEGRLCVRFYRRADGTLLTDDCPVGLAALSSHARPFARWAFAMVLASFCLLLGGAFIVPRASEGGVNHDRYPEPIRRVLDWLFPPTTCVLGAPLSIPPAPAPNEADPIEFQFDR
jgi:hypothetical protein